MPRTIFQVNVSSKAKAMIQAIPAHIPNSTAKHNNKNNKAAI
jgi:hypothetical protein